jgi:hypothetical protein
MGIKGKLTSDVNLSMNSSDISLSSGNIQIKLIDAILVLSDPSLGLPDQSFKTANISIAVANGGVTIDPTTRFVTDGLEMGVDGKMTLKSKIAASPVNLRAFVHLKGSLGEQFGTLVDAVSGGLSKDGVLNLQVGGTVGVLSYVPI